MEIVTGYIGEPHITAAQDRARNQGAFGTGEYVLGVGSKMTATAASASEIRIADGAISMQGCVAVIPSGTYDSVTIANGAQGQNRIDIIVARYTRDPSTGVEDVSLAVIQGTSTTGNPSAPSHTDGDIQAGDTLVEMPLYRVRLTGVSVSLTSIATVLRTLEETYNLASAVQNLYNIDHAILLELTTRMDSAETNISSLTTRTGTAESNISSAQTAITGMIVKKAYTYTYSLAAGGHAYVSGANLGLSTPSGYTPIGVQVLWSGNANVSVMGFQANVTGSSSFCELINHGSSAVSNATLNVSVIYVRSGSYSTR